MRGGGGPLPELKNTIYIFIFDGRKRCTSCPKEGGEREREVIRAMPERKHSFLQEVFPYVEDICGAIKTLKYDQSISSNRI